MKKLSIIVPIYNVKSYVGECIDSLLNQNYSNYEIILVDDGSTDGCREICEQYQKKHSKIIVHSQKNAGLPAARNSGLKIASGDYVAFVDSDDIVHKDMFKKLIESLEKSDADLAVCNFERFGLDHTYQIINFENRIIDYSKDNQLAFFESSVGPCWNKIYKRDVIVKNNIAFESKDIVEQEDYYFEMKYYSHIKRIVFLKDILYFYRIRKSSISNSRQSDNFINKSIEYLKIASAYLLNNSNKEYDVFLQYVTYNMMCACINYSKPKVSAIRDIYKRFVTTKNMFDKEIINRKSSITGFRKRYYKTVFLLINMKLFTIAAIIEKMRINKLNKNSNKEGLFD